MSRDHMIFIVFFFNDTATTEIYTLSLHDALPISSDCISCTRSLPSRSSRPVIVRRCLTISPGYAGSAFRADGQTPADEDRKSTRLNSSHVRISYAVFCLKKKNETLGTTCQATVVV